MSVAESLWNLSYGQALGLGALLVLLAVVTTLAIDYVRRVGRLERRVRELEVRADR